MQIYCCRGKYPNFGDELNHWLWPKLLPDFFDDDASTALIGIGSTLGDPGCVAVKKIVFGAGYVPDYYPLPDMQDGSWDVVCVRGPRTAKRLNLPPDLAIGDSGILLRTQIDRNQQTAEVVSFMPHWESMERGNWQEVCRRTGITLIDPRQPVEQVVAALLRSKMVIAEAMHGAIIADALRIPFVPMLPLNPIHREKWFDWSESLGMVLRPERLMPSSLIEVSRASLFSNLQPLSMDVLPTRSDVKNQNRFLSRLKRAVQTSRLAPRIDARLMDMAAQSLAKIARSEGILSTDVAMEGITTRMLEKLSLLQRNYRK